MEDNGNTSWTPSPDENKLDIKDKKIINELESKGISKAALLRQIKSYS